MSDLTAFASEPYSSDGTENARFDLRSWPFYWVLRTHDRYLLNLENALKAVEFDIPTWRVLMLLGATEAHSVGYLATESCVKLSTMTRIVKRMQDAGLVTTRPRATDARVTEVLLTANGRRARPLAWQQANRIYKTAFGNIERETILELNRVLEKIAGNLVTE